MDFSVDEIRNAYLYLKSGAYYENLNLFLRQRIAAFELDADLEDSFKRIFHVINSPKGATDESFRGWVKSVNYRLLPKMVETKPARKKKDSDTGLFITNVRKSPKYRVSKVNYFIDCPVELLIVDTLWCLYAGPALEESLSKDTYGNRMHPSALSYADRNGDLKGRSIFKRYVDQYNQWRDQAIHVATEIAEEGDNVLLFSLDLKSYYYQVDLNFEEILEAINQHYQSDPTQHSIAVGLTELLHVMFKHYHSVVGPFIKETHAECVGKNGLPIGLFSSSIIANWYLTEFDTIIGDEVRPAYFGRYVDDIIMVFKRPRFSKSEPIPSFVKRYLSSAIVKSDFRSEYIINVRGNELPIQEEKLILQYYDKDHSRAGLTLFKQELDERSSAFRFLPRDHIEKDLDKYAYDILYEGSANKLRSIVGLAENESELAKYLTSHITAYRLCRIDKHDLVLPQLIQFFKGQNALQFARLWEKLYQYSVITAEYNFASTFYEYLETEISNIEVFSAKSRRRSGRISEKLHQDLFLYNKLALSLTIGLLDMIEPLDGLEVFLSDKKSGVFKRPKHKLSEMVTNGSDLHHFAWEFRNSNLIRHHLVSWPLANFSSYVGDLTSDSDVLTSSEISLDDNKILYSPRFVHLDEWQVFHLGRNLNTKAGINDWINDSTEEYRKRFFTDDNSIVFSKKKKSKNSSLSKSVLTIRNSGEKEVLKVAVANLVVAERDIEDAIRKDRSPNLSFSRQEKLYSILNTALREGADILVMPEVAIPVSWLPFMVSFARRNQIGLVFGLEHWVVKRKAYNLTIEALPFRAAGKYNSCIITARVKNHYAPAELEMLKSFRIKPANKGSNRKHVYHKVSWRGAAFATYNCFELSDITHRLIFKSEIDLLFACVWNRDTNYYDHILESTVRDLHCYTVHVNTSQYGGSSVLQPTKTETKKKLYVKGGENPCVLTTNLNIKLLRAFQFKSKPDSKDRFKHLPPGYNHEAVLKR